MNPGDIVTVVEKLSRGVKTKKLEYVGETDYTYQFTNGNYIVTVNKADIKAGDIKILRGEVVMYNKEKKITQEQLLYECRMRGTSEAAKEAIAKKYGVKLGTVKAYYSAWNIASKLKKIKDEAALAATGTEDLNPVAEQKLQELEAMFDEEEKVSPPSEGIFIEQPFKTYSPEELEEKAKQTDLPIDESSREETKNWIMDDDVIKDLGEEIKKLPASDRNVPFPTNTEEFEDRIFALQFNDLTIEFNNISSYVLESEYEEQAIHRYIAIKDKLKEVIESANKMIIAVADNNEKYSAVMELWEKAMSFESGKETALKNYIDSNVIGTEWVKRLLEIEEDFNTKYKYITSDADTLKESVDRYDNHKKCLDGYIKELQELKLKTIDRGHGSSVYNMLRHKIEKFIEQMDKRTNLYDKYIMKEKPAAKTVKQKKKLKVTTLTGEVMYYKLPLPGRIMICSSKGTSIELEMDKLGDFIEELKELKEFISSKQGA